MIVYIQHSLNQQDTLYKGQNREMLTSKANNTSKRVVTYLRVEQSIDDFIEDWVLNSPLGSTNVLVHLKSRTLLGSRGQGLFVYNTHASQTIKGLHSNRIIPRNTMWRVLRVERINWYAMLFSNQTTWSRYKRK